MAILELGFLKIPQSQNSSDPRFPNFSLLQKTIYLSIPSKINDLFFQFCLFCRQPRYQAIYPPSLDLTRGQYNATMYSYIEKPLAATLVCAGA